ncbi:hypothetical protein [Paractinoplanes deccanensis]|uniref:hypothetical protein n=1 Tax=Paractinoplanes deccanensis TaxID=113561 RepID=UPI001944104C|nr:hypothetical protein [Actinoplanes deccanensis]
MSGTTATYLHPLLQSSVLQQSARTADVQPQRLAPTQEMPAVPAVTPIDRTAAYSAGLARDTTAATNTVKATAKVVSAADEADPATMLARQIVMERASSQVGLLLNRAAGERRVALMSGVPAARLADLNTTTSRLYHALDLTA